MTALYHFSDDGGIARFEPRAVFASNRPPGQEWLNGPLVWAIDEWHAPLYYFPRDCPRIVAWPTDTATAADRRAWLRDHGTRMVACIEYEWLDRLRAAVLFRYTLPPATFEELHDAGMWVSREAVTPSACVPMGNLLHELAAAGVELRMLPSLAPLRNAWDSTMHVSGIRLRNARGWPG